MDLKHRAQDLQNFKQREDFRKLVIGFKRVSNIIAESGLLTDADPDLFTEEAEKELHTGYKELTVSIAQKLAGKDYHGIMDELVDFGKVIDRFFDDVLVNVEDLELRNNRYSLLSGIRSLFLKVADIAKIVVEGN